MVGGVQIDHVDFFAVFLIVCFMYLFYMMGHTDCDFIPRVAFIR